MDIFSKLSAHNASAGDGSELIRVLSEQLEAARGSLATAQGNRGNCPPGVITETWPTFHGA